MCGAIQRRRKRGTRERERESEAVASEYTARFESDKEIRLRSICISDGALATIIEFSSHSR
ncbi:hypothetical protein X777_03130 [Ooceraea biroi]|uniref:Uncharacterized protein n=1 Tax=Ooceraea biroi TaxID=2015173 RepID=A0A026WN29_OOCBI|nr:hypothetical protein X777_03130 [Ooceraea biroi]